jgi:hypothetical protein
MGLVWDLPLLLFLTWGGASAPWYASEDNTKLCRLHDHGHRQITKNRARGGKVRDSAPAINCRINIKKQKIHGRL